jgi:ATP-dependent Zn protease
VPRYRKDEKTSYHEAGHAVAAYVCKYAAAVKKVTIVPEGEMLGCMWSYRQPSFHPDQKEDLNRIVDRTTVLLAGASAVKILTGRRQNKGAESDYEKAADMAGYASGNNDEVDALLRWAGIRTKNLLTVHWDLVERTATALMEHKTLSAREFSDLLAK